VLRYAKKTSWSTHYSISFQFPIKRKESKIYYGIALPLVFKREESFVLSRLTKWLGWGEKYLRSRESKAEDKANVGDTAYPGKEDGLDSLSFMAWTKAARLFGF
jgi:hypothetical protein